MPLSDKEKLRAFSEKVIGDANEQAARLATEAYEQKEAITAGRRTEIEASVRAKYTAEYQNRSRTIAAEASRAALARSKEYLALRDEITDKVLARTAQMVADFAEGEDYAQYLCDCAASLAKHMNGPFTLVLRQADLPLADRVVQAAGSGCTGVQTDPGIHCGGALLRADSGAVVVNGTLDQALEGAKDALMLLMGKYLKAEET